MAQIAVVGLGRFGFHVARQAALFGHEVLAIDVEREPVQRIKDHASRAVVFDARDRAGLAALGVAEVDVAVVSLGERVDASALIVLNLRELKVPRILCKAGSDDHGKLLQLIGAHEVVFPERESAERLAMRLSAKNLIEYLPLGDEHGIEEISPPASFAGKRLADLKLPSRFGAQVLAVRSALGGPVRVNPGADHLVTADDLLVVLARNDALERLQRLD